MLRVIEYFAKSVKVTQVIRNHRNDTLKYAACVSPYWYSTVGLTASILYRL